MFLHSGTLGTVLCGVRGWHSEGLRRDFGNDSGSTTLGLASVPLTLFSVQCAVCIIQCSGVTPWFAFVAVHREEDLLDLAPFLADNSRLGERIVITESARMMHHSSLPSLPSHPSLPSIPSISPFLPLPSICPFPSPPYLPSLPLPSISPLPISLDPSLSPHA